MSVDLLLPLDLSRYEWKPSVGADSLCYRRHAAGGEHFTDFTQRSLGGEQLMFFGGNTTLRSPLPLTDFVDRLRDAWVALRYTTPTIALHTERDDIGNPLMTYRVESDVAKIKEWATRTVCIENGVRDLDELCYNLSLKILPDKLGDQTMLYVCHITDLQYGLLIHTSHVPFDGVGLRIVFNRLLTSLATCLGGTPLADMKWGSEVANLTPAMPFITTEPHEGPEYIRTLTTTMEDVHAAMSVSRILFESRRLLKATVTFCTETVWLQSTQCWLRSWPKPSTVDCFVYI